MILRIVLSLLLFPLTAIAEDSFFSCNEKLAKDPEFLTKVQAAYARTSAVETDFQQQSYLAALDLSETSQGVAWFSMPGKMRWDYKNPEEQVFLFKDATVWLYQKTDNQVLVQDVPAVLVSDLPVSFMLGLGNIAKDFSLKSICKSSKGIVAELSPDSKKSKQDDSDQGLESLTLIFNEGEYFPHGARIVQGGGNTTQIVFSNMRFNGNTKGELFDAKFPKGVDIIDKRNG